MLKAWVKIPVLIKQGGIEIGWRVGRGFSIGELGEAGLAVKKARKMGLPIDERRRSVHEYNVSKLKEILGKIE
ncbi:MAG: ribosomal protein L13e [Desulfurococcales archaeon]|nr:ribosomal protein L13e [Desulfurococcales archaeon]